MLHVHAAAHALGLVVAADDGAVMVYDGFGAGTRFGIWCLVGLLDGSASCCEEAEIFFLEGNLRVNKFIAALFENELDFSLISAPCVLFYLLIALMMVFLIRVLGPHSISNYRLESNYDDSTGASNVAYRIMAPVVWCYFFLFVGAATFSVLGVEFSFDVRWMPTALYWLEIFFLKIATRSFGVPLWAFALEAIASVLVAIYFDWAVIAQLPESGPLAVDQSNIGFQVVLALFFALVEIVMAAAIRRKYRIGYVIPFNISYNQMRYYKLLVPAEKRLYEYKRRFGGQLPKRFSEDILLRAIFYSIMCIEDENRPHSVRILENFLARMGVAKSTGIMQQKASHPLTDEESVELAIPYIENMWDRYLRKFAKSIEENHPKVRFAFTSTGYCYDYSAVASALSSNFSLLYGDYCGTRSLQANYVFNEVRRFEERENYNFIQRKVFSTGSVFPEESNYIPNSILCWADSNTIQVVSPASPTFQIVNHENGTSDELLAVINLLRAREFLITSVSFGPVGFQRIQIAGGKADNLPSLGDGWSIECL